MKPRIKVLTAVLVCCALVAAFTACAGCMGSNSIFGAWKCDMSVGSIPSFYYYEFDPDGTYTLTMQVGDRVTKINSRWIKQGANHYQSANRNIDFYLNSDGTQLRCIWDAESGTHYDDVYVRVSASEVPSASKSAKTSGTTNATTYATQIPTQDSATSSALPQYPMSVLDKKEETVQ